MKDHWLFRYLFRIVTTSVVVIVFAQPAVAQTITVTPAACVPLEPFHDDNNHAVVSATVSEITSDAQVRLYFRRMHHVVEDFYYTVMQPDGRGNYWGVLPDPEDREPERFEYDRDDEEDLTDTSRDDTEWADWWKAKEASLDRNPNGNLDDDWIREAASIGAAEERTWMNEMTRDALQDWLEDLENNPTEYFVATYDSLGNRTARSDMYVSIVEPDEDECHIYSTPQQLGEQANMTVGETAEWQHGKPLFQWECTGLVSRFDVEAIKRGDESCRACVVAILPGWVPVAGVAAAAVAGEVVEDPVVSPSEP